MSTIIVDTTVIIHLLRHDILADAWYAAQTQIISITSITWIEVVRGAPNKRMLEHAKTLLDKFEILYLTQTDQDWSMETLYKYSFSRGVQPNDCLIASVCNRLQVPIHTHNVKDMLKVLPASLVVKPY